MTKLIQLIAVAIILQNIMGPRGGGSKALHSARQPPTWLRGGNGSTLVISIQMK